MRNQIIEKAATPGGRDWDYMLRLRSNSTFSKIIKINPDTGEIKAGSIVDLNAKSGLKINGFFEYLNGVLVALYAKSDQLILCIDKTEIPITSDLSVNLNKKGNDRILLITQASNEKANLHYQLKEHRDPSVPTAFIEDENFDFGEFIFNVLNDSKRQRLLIDNWNL